MGTVFILILILILTPMLILILILIILYWLTIKFRIQSKMCTFVIRCLDDGQPSYLSSLLFSADSVKYLRSNNTNKLKVPRSRTKFGAVAFSASGPTLWYFLHAHLRVARNLFSIRKLLKTHLWLFRPSSSASRLPGDNHAYSPRLFFGIW